MRAFNFSSLMSLLRFVFLSFLNSLFDHYSLLRFWIIVFILFFLMLLVFWIRKNILARTKFLIFSLLLSNLFMIFSFCCILEHISSMLVGKLLLCLLIYLICTCSNPMFFLHCANSSTLHLFHMLSLNFWWMCYKAFHIITSTFFSKVLVLIDYSSLCNLVYS